MALTGNYLRLFKDVTDVQRVKTCGDFCEKCIQKAKVSVNLHFLLLCLQQTLKVNIKSVAVTGGFVWTGLDLLGFLGAEGIRSGVFNVHLKFSEDLQGILQLCITATQRHSRDDD